MKRISKPTLYKYIYAGLANVDKAVKNKKEKLTPFRKLSSLSHQENFVFASLVSLSQSLGSVASVYMIRCLLVSICWLCSQRTKCFGIINLRKSNLFLYNHPYYFYSYQCP